MQSAIQGELEVPVGAGLCVLLVLPSPPCGSRCARACRVLALDWLVQTKPGPFSYLWLQGLPACP